MKKIIILLLLIVCFHSLSSAKDVLFTHKVTYNKKGSRSESRTGSLYINEFRVPFVFDYIQTSDTLYKNHIRYTPFGNHGYFPEEKLLEIRSSDTLCSEKDLSKGFYLTSQNRFAGTPESWIYVRWDRGSAFINPDVIKELMLEKPFSDLQEKGIFHLRKLQPLKNKNIENNDSDL